MRKRAVIRKSGSEALVTNNNNKFPRLGKFKVSQFILRENVKDPDPVQHSQPKVSRWE